MGKVPGNNGDYVDSKSHEGLVTPEIFNRVQSQLKKHNKSAHYIELIDYPFRKIIRCADCRRLFTPYIKKGIMYFGARCDKSCSNPIKNINLEFLTKKTSSLMEELLFTKGELDELDVSVKTDVADLDKKHIDQLEENERKKKKIREDLAYLNENKLSLLRSGAYAPEKLASEEASLNLNLKSLCEDGGASNVSMTETIKDVMKLSELLKDTIPQYSLANPKEKEQILKVIFSELTLSGTDLKFKTKNGFQSLESRLRNRFVAPCARGGS